MINSGSIGPSGALSIQHIKGQQVAPWEWRLRNTLRPSYLFGWAAQQLAKGLTKLTGIPTITSKLSAKLVRADGTSVDYGVVSYRVVTAVGVAFLVDDWDNNGQDITTMNFHGCGTGTNAENSSDTTLQTESTTILNPNSVRSAGTRSQPSANVYRSAGTVTFDGAGAITEHGIFSDTDTGEGVLWDRSVFSAINVVSTDSIVFTYDVTITAGS
jgi:hypothetical protein